MRNNLHIFILILTFVLIHSAKAEDTILKPNILDTLVIVDGDKESRTINFIKWQLDSTSASTDDFLIEDIKYSFDKIFNLSFGYSKYLFKFNKTTKLYGSVSMLLLSSNVSKIGIERYGTDGGFPLNLNIIIGDMHCIDLGFGYTRLFLSTNDSKNKSSDIFNFDVAYRYQFKYPRSTKPLPKGMMMKFGISTIYDFNNIQIIDKKFIISLYAGIGLPL